MIYKWVIKNKAGEYLREKANVDSEFSRNIEIAQLYNTRRQAKEELEECEKVVKVSVTIKEKNAPRKKASS